MYTSTSIHLVKRTPICSRLLLPSSFNYCYMLVTNLQKSSSTTSSKRKETKKRNPWQWKIIWWWWDSFQKACKLHVYLTTLADTCWGIVVIYLRMEKFCSHQYFSLSYMPSFNRILKYWRPQIFWLSFCGVYSSNFSSSLGCLLTKNHPST